MNPQFEQSQGLRLPEPSGEGSAQGGLGKEKVGTPEASQHNAEVAATPPSAPPAPPTASYEPPASASQAAQVGLATDMPAVADDNDDPSLDEEWIAKAKEIVDRTRTDPFVQSKEISKFKADYLKVRHNRTVKLAEDRPK